MGVLYIVATPIGNREDITFRALKTLFLSDYILCEDTRKTKSLLIFYQTTQPYSDIVKDTKMGKLLSFYKENEMQRTYEVIELIKKGKTVSLVSNAGTPVISDPGYLLVKECHNENILVTCIPGPSSVTSALSISGLPARPFIFLGFLPKKEIKRKMILRETIKSITHLPYKTCTVILFESPQRIKNTLSYIHKLSSVHNVKILHELTKKNEKVMTLDKEIFSNLPSKGEYVIVLQVR